MNAPENNPHKWWQSACEAARRGERVPPMLETKPELGRYRMKRGHRWLPVAIWNEENGELVVLVGYGDDAHTSHEPLQVWLDCASHPTSEEAYDDAFKTGVWWPDVLSETPPPAEVMAAISADAPPPMGHNSQHMTDDERAEIAAKEAAENDPQRMAESEISRTVSAATTWLGKIGKRALKDQGEADAAGSLVDAISKALTGIDKVHKTLKDPYLRAGQKLDSWKNEQKAAAATALKALTGVVRDFLVAEQARRDAERLAAEKKAREEAEAERQRLEAERAAQAAAEQVPAEEIAALPPIEVAPEPVAKVEPVKAGGGAGKRGLTLRPVQKPIIVDYAKALAAAANEEEVKGAVQAVADRMWRAKIKLDGVEIRETQEARR